MRSGLAVGRSSAPCLRVSPDVGDGENHQLLADDSEEDRVGEPVAQDPSGGAFDYGVGQRLFRGSQNRSIDLVGQVEPEARLLVFVPVHCFEDIQPREREDNQLVADPLRARRA